MNGQLTFDVENREDVDRLCCLVVGLCMHSGGFHTSGEILHAIDADATALAMLLDSVLWSSPLSVIITFLKHGETLPNHYTIAEFSKAVTTKEIT